MFTRATPTVSSISLTVDRAGPAGRRLILGGGRLPLWGTNCAWPVPYNPAGKGWLLPARVLSPRKLQARGDPHAPAKATRPARPRGDGEADLSGLAVVLGGDFEHGGGGGW